jgi:hypothetical protein
MKRQWLALLLIAMVFGGLAAHFLLGDSPHRNALRARQLATRSLAEFIARTHSGHRVLVVSNPFTQRRGIAREIIETEEAGIRGLREGFGKAVAVGAIGYPALKPEALENPRSLISDVETTTPLSYLVADDAFDKLAEGHADCDIIVSLVGLPANLSECETWQAAGARKFALLFPDLRIIGDTAAVQRALQSGKLLAFLLRKPGGVDDQRPLGKDLQAEFDKRFVLVSAENVEQVRSKYPNLF